MNNGFVINDKQKMLDIISDIESNIKNIRDVFDDENNNFSEIEKGEIWDSSLQKSVVEKYNELKNNYDTIIDTLNSYALFVKSVVEKYEEINKSIISKLDGNDMEG